MKYSVITLFPELIDSYCSTSIIGRAQKHASITVETVNPRDFTRDKYRSVDDTPYGGGSGMVLMCDPIYKAVESINFSDNSVILLTSPHGRVFDQQMAKELTRTKHIGIICGHYEGFDERIKEGLDVIEVSLGDFVLTGGELAAMAIIDATARLLKGVLGKEESFQEESFSDGLLEYPHYTRPAEYKGMKVPEILLSGHHKNIETWRRQQSIITTYQKRPDLLENVELTFEELQFLNEYILSNEEE